MRCRACSRHTELAGPVLEARCKHCSAEIAIPPKSWASALGAIDERSTSIEGTRLESHHHQDELAELRFRWSTQALSCRECRVRLPLLEIGALEPLLCGGCGAKMATYPAPPWLRAELPTAQQLYGVEYVFEAAALDPEARKWWLCLLGTPKKQATERMVVTELAVQHALLQEKPKKTPLWVYLLIALVAAVLVWQGMVFMQKLEEGAGSVLDGT